jgi:hypothetical protein
VDDLLPPPALPGPPMPWRALGALFVPAAALAAGVGLQRAFEGPIPSGDAPLRWLLWSWAAGILAGLGGYGAAEKKIIFFFWAGYGVVAPWAVAGLVAGAVAAVRPVREGLADRREHACRASGRSVCTAAPNSPQPALRRGAIRAARRSASRSRSFAARRFAPSAGSIRAPSGPRPGPSRGCCSAPS